MHYFNSTSSRSTRLPAARRISTAATTFRLTPNSFIVLFYLLSPCCTNAIAEPQPLTATQKAPQTIAPPAGSTIPEKTTRAAVDYSQMDFPALRDARSAVLHQIDAAQEELNALRQAE